MAIIGEWIRRLAYLVRRRRLDEELRLERNPWRSCPALATLKQIALNTQLDLNATVPHAATSCSWSQITMPTMSDSSSSCAARSARGLPGKITVPVTEDFRAFV